MLESDDGMDVDSLLCDSSTVISEDFNFLNKEKHNYLHLVIQPDKLEMMNPMFQTMYEEDDDGNSTLDYLIEIGCKVTSVDKFNVHIPL
jgi:hypothetical protein